MDEWFKLYRSSRSGWDCGAVMDVKTIHRMLVERDQSTLGGKLPITPKKGTPIVIPVNAWKRQDGAIVKKYEFFEQDARDSFVVGLLQYERIKQHPAVLLVKELSVTVKLETKNIGVVTEIDKEYAAYADVLFKDIVYAPDSLE